MRYDSGEEIVVDPPAEAVLDSGRDICLLITHGHPEHIEGAAALLADPARRGRVTVVASPGICRFMKRAAKANGDDLFFPCRPGQTIEIAGLRIDAFAWRHMTLLPPGLGPALGHVARLVASPAVALGIVLRALKGPLPGPMLGFRVAAAGGPKVLFYGEGLHRKTDLEETRRLGQQWPADVILAAVEPEDCDALPDLIKAAGPPLAVPYQAHWIWRKSLGLALADMDQLAGRLEDSGITVRRLRPGHSLTLGPSSAAPAPQGDS